MRSHEKSVPEGRLQIHLFLQEGDQFRQYRSVDDRQYDPRYDLQKEIAEDQGKGIVPVEFRIHIQLQQVQRRHQDGGKDADQDDLYVG